MILAELFDDRHTREPFKLLPYAGGGYVVFHTLAPNSQGVVAGPFDKIDRAHEVLEQLAASQVADEDVHGLRRGDQHGADRSTSSAASDAAE